VKEVFQISPTEMEFHFSDNVSVFDKIVPGEIPGKGETLCKTSAYWFERAEELGVNTHFIEISEKDKMKVKRVDVTEDDDEIDKDTRGYRIPLEFVTRYHVEDSLYERLEKGEVDHRELGFDEKPDHGDRLPEPRFEITTKLEEDKRSIGEEEALSISGLTEDEFYRLKEIVFEIDDMIRENAEGNDLIFVEGSKEFAMDEERELMVIDTFGTADEDLFWDAEAYEEGRTVQNNKEFIRQYYRDLGYYEKLIEARKEGKKEPPIPSLPEEMIKKASNTYVDMMARLTDGNYGDRI